MPKYLPKIQDSSGILKNPVIFLKGLIPGNAAPKNIYRNFAGLKIETWITF